MAKQYSTSPYSFALAIWLTGLFLIDYALYYLLGESLDPWIQLFIAMNIASFLLFGFDKVQAQTKRRRIPELILYLSAFLGGPIGSIAGMHIFRHKTRKLSFQVILAILIGIQIYIATLLIK